MGGTDVGERTAGSGLVGETISVDELDQITKNFADRYVLFVANACDDIKERAVSAEQRRNAHRLKLAVATAAYDIATGPDAVKQLVDMAVLVDLHHIVWVEEGQSIRFFDADAGAHLSRAFTAAQEEIWGLAGRVMTPEQVEALETAVQDWRRRHPAVEWVSDIRFDVVAGGEGVTLIGGTLGILTPASGNISDSIGQSRLLGQRAFYYSKRLPRLLDWQVEAAVDNALTVPAASTVIQEVPPILDKAAEILAQMDNLVDPSPELQGLEPSPRFVEIRQALAESKDLAIAVRQAAESFEVLLNSFRKMKEPFEISEYTAAAEQFGMAVREASDLLHETKDVAESESATRRFTEVMNTVARDLATQARAATDHAAWRAAELIVLFVGLLSIGAGILLWLGRSKRGVPKEPAR